MSGFTRLRGRSILMLGLALILVPASLQAQTAEERAREQELRQRIEARLQAVQQERLVHLEEALARAREQVAQAEFSHQEMGAAQLERLEQMLVEAQAQAEHAHFNQEEMLARQLEVQAEAQARAQARAEEVRARYEGVAAEYKARAQEAQERAQQVMVRVRARVRLGVSLDGTQGDDLDSRGARIQSVMEGTPAEESGLQEGDIITHLNGHSLLEPIPNEDEAELNEDESLPVQRLMALAQELDAGDEVEVRYLRDGEAQTVAFEAADIEEPSITILRGDPGERGFRGIVRFDPEESGTWSFSLPDREDFEFEFADPEDLEKLKIEMKELQGLQGLEGLKLELKDLYGDAPNVQFRAFPEGNIRTWTPGSGDAPFIYNFMAGTAGFGLELTEMRPGLAEYFSTDEGLLVLNVDEESTLGLMAGDVILAIDGREVEDQGDVRRILGSYEGEETVSFTIMRKGQQTTVEGTIR